MRQPWWTYLATGLGALVAMGLGAVCARVGLMLWRLMAST